MAKELILVPKAEYEKLLSDNQTRRSSTADSFISTQNSDKQSTPIHSDKQSTSLHKNVNEPAGDDNETNPKEPPMLSIAKIRNGEQKNAEGNHELKSHSIKVESSRKPNKNKFAIHDQSGGQHRKYVKQSFAEFLGNKRRPRWIPYKI